MIQEVETDNATDLVLQQAPTDVSLQPTSCELEQIDKKIHDLEDKGVHTGIPTRLIVAPRELFESLLKLQLQLLMSTMYSPLYRLLSFLRNSNS